MMETSNSRHGGMESWMTTNVRVRAGSGAVALLLAFAAPAAAQLSRTYEQFYLPAGHNWTFRREYPSADRLFNAFDYGHAILYEKLYTRPGAPASELEGKEYDFITRRLLVSPPRLPLEEAAIEVEYAKLAPEAKMMFDWAHLLHRQIYDVLADEDLSQAEKDAEVAALLSYYKSRPDLAFSSRPKNMDLMEGQYYSTAFREGWPKFNGLIWGYHWLQVGLYEPLMTGRSQEERQAGVNAAVTRFRQMLVNAPEHMPRVMPMTAAIAPAFTARYPEAAIIFDNLHAMHDVISDILASPKVPREKKREEILTAARRYRDDTSFVMGVDEWRQMAQMMGTNNMGGPVLGFLEEFPEPTLPRGAVMAGMEHGGMPGMNHAGMQGMQGQAGSASGHAGMQHGDSTGGGQGTMQGMDYAGMPGMQPGQGGMPGMQHGAPAPGSVSMQRMMEIHARMMADPVIRARVAADPELQRMMAEMHGAGEMQGMDHAGMAPGSTAAADSAQAVDFVVRLLSDPQVAARVHSDPELHRLWSDPEVQRRLAELRRAPSTPAPNPEHRH